MFLLLQDQRKLSAVGHNHIALQKSERLTAGNLTRRQFRT